LSEKKTNPLDIDRGKKFTHFQVEMERLGRKYTLEVRVLDVRVGRGKREIWSEGYTRDAFNIVEFRTRGAESYIDTVWLTLEAADHRGFIPRSFRLWEGGKWGEWHEVMGYPKAKPNAVEREKQSRVADKADG